MAKQAETVDIDEKTAIETEPVSTDVEKGLADEIDGAIVDVVEENEKERKASQPEPKAKEDLPLETKVVEEVVDDNKADPPVVKPADAEKPAITDEHLTRAVKAGLSIADARSFQSASALENVCAALEAKTEAKADDKVATGDVDPIDAIPDLDPEVYDETIVSIVKTLKGIAKTQQGIIKGLTDSAGAGSGTLMDSQINGLGEGFEDALGKGPTSKLDASGPQAANRAKLASKVKVLEAGYKAAGEDVDKAEVFAEAVSIVLGDVVRDVDAKAKAKLASKRAAIHTARPGSGQSNEDTDVFDDVAAELDRKFGDGKK